MFVPSKRHTHTHNKQQHIKSSLHNISSDLCLCALVAVHERRAPVGGRSLLVALMLLLLLLLLLLLIWLSGRSLHLASCYLAAATAAAGERKSKRANKLGAAAYKTTARSMNFLSPLALARVLQQNTPHIMHLSTFSHVSSAFCHSIAHKHTHTQGVE